MTEINPLNYFQKNKPLSSQNNILGNYRLISQLGSGTYGHVYLAKNQEEKKIAVKIADPDLYAKYPKYLRKEYQVGRKISQSCISTPVYISSEDQILPASELIPKPWWGKNTLIIELEYLEGYSLSKYLKRKKGLNPHELWNLLEWLTATVKCLHFHRFVHGDLHLENIFFTNKGYYLIDFGASCRLSKKRGVQTKKLINCRMTNLQSPDYYTLPILRDRRFQQKLSKSSKINYLPEDEKDYFRMNDLYSIFIISLSAVQPHLFRSQYCDILDATPEDIEKIVQDYRRTYNNELSSGLINLIVDYFTQLQFKTDEDMPELSIDTFYEQLKLLKKFD